MIAVKCPEYDMVVVGAGPAGASAARTACRHGITALLIDARKNPGSPVQCAEYVPHAVKKYVALAPEAVVQKIRSFGTLDKRQVRVYISAAHYSMCDII